MSILPTALCLLAVHLAALPVVAAPALAAAAVTGSPQRQISRADTLYAAWRPLLAAELHRAETRLLPQDLYKFLHQGVLGPAHAVTDTANVRIRLLREWQLAGELEASGRPPLTVPLRPDGRLVRVDLVRLRHVVAAPKPQTDRSASASLDAAQQGTPTQAAALDTLARAFVATAAAWPSATEHLATLWTAVRRDSLLWADHFDAAALQTFHAEVQAGWPAVHHSEAYRQHRQPHYRVIAVEHLPAAWLRARATP